MGSALLFIGIGIITYIIVLGILMQFVPVILGTVFGVIENTMDSFNMDATWLAVYNDVNGLAAYLVPMMFSLILVLLVIKVLMIAGVRGGD